MKIKTDFLKIGRHDVSLLKERVAAIPEDVWGANDARQERFAVHQDTQTIHLLFDDDFRHENPTEWEIYGELKDVLQPLLNKISRFYSASAKARKLREEFGYGYFIRINLVRLRAGGTVKKHMDRGYSLAHSHRVHVPIVTNDRVDFTVGKQTISMKEGEIWEVCNRRVHRVENNGDQPRINLIADWVIPGERCCCGQKLRPEGACNPFICEPTDMAGMPCDCYEG
jgi:hypothetical protein